MNADKRKAYLRLAKENADFKGWICIGGTLLDYPVMYTPDEPEYYLRRNFEKEYSVYGAPFIAGNCKEEMDFDNIIVYGHYVQNGQMFGSLKQYKDKAYFNKHPAINFDTVNRIARYDIMAVILTNDGETGFPYYDFVEAEDEKTYEEYIKKVKNPSIYQTEVYAVYGQQLLTLCTCDGSQKNGRLVIVAMEAKAEEI